MKAKRLILIMLVLGLAALACGGIPSDPDATEPSYPGSQLDSKAALQTFARDVLGLEIESMLAGGTSGEINLPISTQEGVDVAIALAGTTYFGIWKQGVASLSFGDGSVSGDWVADVKDGSLGVFAVRSDQPVPGDANSALQTILATFPALNAYSFFETPSETGFSFTAGDADDVSVMGWSVTLTGSTINIGVAPQPVGERSIIWAVFASGELAKPFE